MRFIKYKTIMALSFIRKNTDPLVTIVIIAALALVIFLTFKYIAAQNETIKAHEAQIAYFMEQAEVWKAVGERNQKLSDEIAFLKREIEALKSVNEGLAARNDELEPIFEAQETEIGELRKKIEELENIISKSALGMEELIIQNEELLQRWIAQAEKRPQPLEKFKITFYSTDKTYEHLIPGKTVAMNSQQVAELGLRKGDEIYIKSGKGWSGFYTITDSGCAYGTIDIYVARGEIPSYGVEYDVTIIIG